MLLMGTLDFPGKGLIGSLEEYLTEVLKPALKFIPHWGELDKSPSGKKLTRGFVETVDTFTASLHGLCPEVSDKDSLQTHINLFCSL